MKRRARHTRFPQDALTGIRQIVEIETEQLEPAREPFLLLPDAVEEDLAPLRIPGPEDRQILVPQPVGWKRDRFFIGAFVGPTEYRVEPIGPTTLPSERDDFVIPAKGTTGQLFSDLRGNVECLKLRGDHLRDRQATPFSPRAPLLRNDLLQRLRSLPDVGTSFRQVPLGKQEVGIQSKLGVFVRRLRQARTRLKKGFAVSCRHLQADESFLTPKLDSQHMELVRGSRRVPQQRRRLAGYPFAGPADVDLRLPCHGLSKLLLQGDDFVLGDGVGLGRFANTEPP
ncbi:MAG: hypothetical protein ACPGJR_00265 [Akkermansiaceae bacterium]